MPDFAPHQTEAYRATHYDRADNTLGTEPRDIDDAARVAVRQAYLDANLLHGCQRCAGTFWDKGARDEHEGRCAG